jgi:hypothetical protein
LERFSLEDKVSSSNDFIQVQVSNAKGRLVVRSTKSRWDISQFDAS